MANPASSKSFPTASGDFAEGVVMLGLDAQGQAWPIGSPNVAFGNAGGAAAAAASSTPADFSANPVAIPMAGLVLLVTIPANPARLSVEVQNQSAAQVQLVRDVGDGTQVSSVLLASGGTAGSQGGGWSSTTFKGRVRVYGASGAQISAFQE